MEDLRAITEHKNLVLQITLYLKSFAEVLVEDHERLLINQERRKNIAHIKLIQSWRSSFIKHEGIKRQIPGNIREISSKTRWTL